MINVAHLPVQLDQHKPLVSQHLSFHQHVVCDQCQPSMPLNESMQMDQKMKFHLHGHLSINPMSILTSTILFILIQTSSLQHHLHITVINSHPLQNMVFWETRHYPPKPIRVSLKKKSFSQSITMLIYPTWVTLWILLPLYHSGSTYLSCFSHLVKKHGLFSRHLQQHGYCVWLLSLKAQP